MPKLTRDHVDRPRLRRRADGASVVVIEAPSGFGKSTLATEISDPARTVHVALGPLDRDAASLVRSLRRAFVRVEEAAAVSALDGADGDPHTALTSLTEALAERPPLCLVLDDAHHLDAQAEILVELVRRRPPPLRVIMTARVLPVAARTVVSLPEVTHLVSHDLRFTVDEAAELLHRRFGVRLPDDRLTELVAETDGWPAGLALAGSRLSHADGDGAAIDGATLVGAFADGVLHTIPEGVRDTVVALAHLPVITVAAAEAISGRPGVLDEVLAVGLPLTRDSSGHIRMPGAVSEALSRTHSLDIDVARRIAAVYLDSEYPFAAIEVLRLVNAHDDIARILCTMPANARRRITADEVIATIDVLPRSVVDSHPAVLVELARAAARTGVPDAQRSALERAEAAAGAHLTPELARAIDVERMTYELYTLFLQDREGQQLRARAHVAACGVGEERTLGRALAVLGQQLAWEGRRGEADHVLRRAARILADQGDNATASGALVQLGFNVHLHEQLAAAEESFAAAVELAADQGRARATALTYLGEVKIWRGRVDEGAVDLDEAAELARAARDARAHAYAAWGLALHASISGETEQTISRVEQAGRLLREWMDTGVGATYAATMTDLLDRAGAHGEADRMWHTTASRRSEAPELATLAEFGIAARRGDPTRAEQLWRHVDNDDGIEPFERVRCRILRAYAALRRSDPETIARYREVLADGESLGPDGVPWHLEPDATRALHAWWSQHNSGWRISVLRPIEVTRGGSPVDIPTGRPLELVTLVALHRAPISIDSVLDTLWGESASDASLARLRQVLYRLRQAAPDLIVRGDATLRLGAECTVDLAEFVQLRDRAMRDPLGDDYARRALALLSPDWFTWVPPRRVADAVEDSRFSVRADAVALCELIADRSRNTAIAEEFLLRAHDLDPADGARAGRLASQLMAGGRVTEARTILLSTLRTLDELGVEPPAGLHTLYDRIRTPA